MNYYSITIETLAFLYEILKLYNFRYIYNYIIRILKLPKIAKSIVYSLLYYI
jgi:hypothetical protein